MHRIDCRTMIAVLGLATNVAIADGPDRDTAVRNASPELTPAAEALLDEFAFASQVQLTDEVPALTYPDAFAAPLTGLELLRSSRLRTSSESRRLSLLTLAEIGKAELFFGVSSNGTLGLHFGAASRQGDHDDAKSARTAYTGARAGL